MLRFRFVYDGKPEEALEWFERLYADMKIEFDVKRDENGELLPVEDPIVRYPISFRIGTYREMFTVPVNGTSIVFGLGSIGKSTDYKRGFLEFNPAKTFPSEQLEYIYKRIGETKEARLQLVKWDFATDYKLRRDSLNMLKDKRTYCFISSNGVTEYLGTRGNNGFVKLYDKQREIEAKGGVCEGPLTRLEITLNEEKRKGGELKEWPQVVMVPNTVNPKCKSILMLIFTAWLDGVPPEKMVSVLSHNKRAEYRNKIKEECGTIPRPEQYEQCRRSAYSWEKIYGGGIALDPIV